jgi:uncharacterized protein
MNDFVSQTAKFVRSKLEGEGSGHDWWHIDRVWKNSKLIASSEKVDLEIVELVALLHDISDWKFNDGDDSVGPKVAGEFLESIGFDKEKIEKIKVDIAGISFKGANEERKELSFECQVVQDADRLDAIGAIGIARCFAYGGYKNREIYNPEIKFNPNQTSDEYKKNTNPSINHFYEKLLLLKDLMNTKSGKEIAEGRHKFMEAYLDQFYSEAEGQK